MKKSVVAMTGASGFAGTNLVKYLTERAFSVIKVSRMVGSEDNNSIDYSQFSEDFIDRHNIQIIIHLAGKAHDLKNVSSEDEYYSANTHLTESLFDIFMKSKASCFVFVSSVKAAQDNPAFIVTEESPEVPKTVYGKSKLKAEEYIREKSIAIDKRVYILRPCMMHGPGNKGNLNLLYKTITKKLPWPLGAFNNKRSFLSIENFCYAVSELISRGNLPSGVYNVADSDPLSTNELVNLIGQELGTKPVILKLPKSVIQVCARIGDIFYLPINSERLGKLTGDYVVSNRKLVEALESPLPISSSDGMRATIRSFLEGKD